MELELIWVLGNWVLTWCPKMDIMAWSWQTDFSPFTLGVIYWIWVSRYLVDNVTESHGQRICLGIGLLGDFKKA